MECSWIKNIVTYFDGEDLMAKVSGTIRRMGFKTVGMEYGMERDAYIFFYETFKRLNPSVKVKDVSKIITEMRLIKDQYEIDAIRKAGVKAKKALEAAFSAVKPGVSETEIAAEDYSVLYRMGSEEPLVYVNAGPHPRVHAEPLSDHKVRNNTFVTIVIEADHYRYYANKADTIYLGSPTGKALEALKCMEEIYTIANKLTRPGRKPIEIMKELDKIYAKYGMLEYRILGYTHSTGLQVEETPVTTIVPAHRFIEIKEGMTLAYVHAPIMLKGLGQIKKEDTFLIGGKENEKLT
jgi:Xaa-Pro dipeptidase